MEKGNHYKNYIMESYNRHLFENETGFATYSIVEDYAIIHAMYVQPFYRNAKVGSRMANDIKNIVKKEGCTKFVCEIDKASNTYDQAYKSITGYGFKLINENDRYLILERDI